MCITDEQAERIVDMINGAFKAQKKKARVATLSLVPKSCYFPHSEILVGFTGRVMSELKFSDEDFKYAFEGITDAKRNEGQDYSCMSFEVSDEYNEDILYYHYKQGYRKDQVKQNA